MAENKLPSRFQIDEIVGIKDDILNDAFIIKQIRFSKKKIYYYLKNQRTQEKLIISSDKICRYLIFN